MVARHVASQLSRAFPEKHPPPLLMGDEVVGVASPAQFSVANIMDLDTGSASPRGAPTAFGARCAAGVLSSSSPARVLRLPSGEVIETFPVCP